MTWTFVLLGLAICVVWLPNISLAGNVALPPWVLAFAAAILAGLSEGALTPAALPFLAALAALTWASTAVSAQGWSTLLTTLAAFLAIALSLHLLPGFNNQPLIHAVKLSPDAAPFTQYLNFDKGTVGLLFLAAYAPRMRSLAELREVVRPTLVAIGGTVVLVFGAAMASGYVRPDLKLPALTLTFVAVNLLFTCVAEEVFFRGLIQERLARWVERLTATAKLGSRLQRSSALRWLPVAVSTVLFALAHFAGGPPLVLLAGLAGLGYAVAYMQTRRIEVAIATHISVNVFHFLGFTYPYVAP